MKTVSSLFFLSPCFLSTKRNIKVLFTYTHEFMEACNLCVYD